MMYQTLHTPPITPEESCRLETIFDVTEVVKSIHLLYMRLSDKRTTSFESTNLSGSSLIKFLINQVFN